MTRTAARCRCTNGSPYPIRFMSCCQAADRFFDDTMARHDLRRYRRRGPLRSARKMLMALGPVDGRSILDIGGGVGAVTHGVLAAGAHRVTAVDASRAYLQALVQEAQRQGHAERITTRFGDFTTLAADLRPVDVATLDRVLCCYPNLDLLLTTVAQQTRWRIGMVYPRGTWWSCMGIRLFNIIQMARHHAFRVFHHDPSNVDALLQAAGFQLAASDQTLIWQIAIYERA